MYPQKSGPPVHASRSGLLTCLLIERELSGLGLSRAENLSNTTRSAELKGYTHSTLPLTLLCSHCCVDDIFALALSIMFRMLFWGREQACMCLSPCKLHLDLNYSIYIYPFLRRIIGTRSLLLRNALCMSAGFFLRCLDFNPGMVN